MAQEYNLQANGSTTALPIAGKFNIGAFGTFGGGTLTIQLSYDSGTTWIAATDGSGSAGAFTADGTLNVEVGEALLRLTLAGATSPDIDIAIIAIH